MELESALAERVARYEAMSRWERSELGRDLRRTGLSYGEIMDLIPVKKSTLASWCRDIRLTAVQIDAIRERRAPTAGLPRDTQWRRRAEIRDLREQAARQVERLLHDPLWVAGTVLYWAEGGKTRNDLKLANSDPRALRLFICWIERYVVADPRFSLHLHLHEGNDESAAQRYWRRETGLEEAGFHKSFIKPRGTGQRKNHLQHGICTVVVHKPADPWQIIMAWIDGLADRLGLPHPSN